MPWAVSADPVEFNEAIEWFRTRFPVTDELLAALREYAGRRAWKVSGIAELDIVLEVYESLLAAIETGATLEEWKAEIKTTVGARWGEKTSWRLETIFRTNVQTAYNRGRWQQITDPDVIGVRPFIMFDAILDARRSPICKSLSEPKPVLLPASDPFWLSHQPPLHFNCRSSLRSLTESQAKASGVTTRAPDTEPQKGFGGVDHEWQPDPQQYPPELWAIYSQKAAAR